MASNVAIREHLISRARFDTKGRGVVVDGYVLVSKGKDDVVISQSDWLARLNQFCKHGKQGWSCKCFSIKQ